MVKLISNHFVGHALSEGIKWEKKKCKSMKWLKDAEHGNPEDALVIWIG
jgi:hypothetical protein